MINDWIAMVDTSPTTVAQLKELLAAGAFSPSPDPESPFVTSPYYLAFGHSIEPTVAGVIDLAEAGGGNLADITGCEETVYCSSAHVGSHTEERYKFLFYVKPEGLYLLGPNRQLGLRAVVLETRRDWGKLTSKLSLVFFAWPAGQTSPLEGEVVKFTLHSTGATESVKFSPRFGREDGGAPLDDPEAFLSHQLGVTNRGFKAGVCIRPVDELLNLPGAEAYFGGMLPGFGEEIAKQHAL